MLSLSVGYVLDYIPSDNLKRKASLPHKRALVLIGTELIRAVNFGNWQRRAFADGTVITETRRHCELDDLKIDQAQSQLVQGLSSREDAPGAVRPRLFVSAIDECTKYVGPILHEPLPNEEPYPKRHVRSHGGRY